LATLHQGATTVDRRRQAYGQHQLDQGHRPETGKPIDYDPTRTCSSMRASRRPPAEPVSGFAPQYQRQQLLAVLLQPEDQAPHIPAMTACGDMQQPATRRTRQGSGRFTRSGSGYRAPER
jgi:hypothetical protein